VAIHISIHAVFNFQLTKAEDGDNKRCERATADGITIVDVDGGARRRTATTKTRWRVVLMSMTSAGVAEEA
jgi:hypothetical protein